VAYSPRAITAVAERSIRSTARAEIAQPEGWGAAETIDLE